MVLTLYQKASIKQRKVFWGVCLLFLIGTVYLRRKTVDLNTSVIIESSTCRKCNVKDQILDPHYQIVKHEKNVADDQSPPTEMVWQIPEKPRGVVLLAHGCSHRATDFWSYASSCSKCVGLPEEVYIVKVALSYGLAPIAMSSHFTPCWSERDVAIVADTLADWLKEHKLLNVPLFAVGASSGGSFVGPFADQVNKRQQYQEVGLKVQAIDVQIATFSTIPKGVTSVAITRMSRDERTADFVTGMAPELTREGLPVLLNVAEPLALTETFFYDRIEKLSRTDSALLYEALRKGGLLDEKGFLLEDPRESDWRSAIKSYFPEILQSDSLLADESAISEEMNVAWAMHEFTGDFVARSFDFFLVHVK